MTTKSTKPVGETMIYTMKSRKSNVKKKFTVTVNGGKQ